MDTHKIRDRINELESQREHNKSNKVSLNFILTALSISVILLVYELQKQPVDVFSLIKSFLIFSITLIIYLILNSLFFKKEDKIYKKIQKNYDLLLKRK